MTTQALRGLVRSTSGSNLVPTLIGNNGRFAFKVFEEAADSSSKMLQEFNAISHLPNPAASVKHTMHRFPSKTKIQSFDANHAVAAAYCLQATTQPSTGSLMSVLETNSHTMQLTSSDIVSSARVAFIEGALRAQEAIIQNAQPIRVAQAGQPLLSEATSALGNATKTVAQAAVSGMDAVMGSVSEAAANGLGLADAIIASGVLTGGIIVKAYCEEAETDNSRNVSPIPENHDQDDSPNRSMAASPREKSTKLFTFVAGFLANLEASQSDGNTDRSQNTDATVGTDSVGAKAVPVEQAREVSGDSDLGLYSFMGSI